DGNHSGTVCGYGGHGGDLAVVSRNGRVGPSPPKNGRECNRLALVGRLDHDGWRSLSFHVCLLCCSVRNQSGIAGGVGRWSGVFAGWNCGIVDLWSGGFQVNEGRDRLASYGGFLHAGMVMYRRGWELVAHTAAG